MSNTFDLNGNLAKLHDELDRLRSSTAQIEKADSAAKSVVQAGQDLMPQLELLQQETREMLTQAKEVLAAIQAVNFPSRLDKLDNTVSSTTLAVQSLQSEMQEQSRRWADIAEQSNDMRRKLSATRWLIVGVLGLLIPLGLATMALYQHFWGG